MVFGSQNYNVSDGEDKNLAYDLRQIYAKLLGEHLIDASISRKENNF